MSNVQSRLNPVLQNGYEFRLGDYISQGFNIFGRNAGLFIGYVIVYFLISIVLAVIPFIGSIGSMLISGALSAGFAIVADKTVKGDYVSFSNFFDGFKDWVNLFLVGLISGLLVVLAFIPAIIYLFVTVGLEGLMRGGLDGDSPLSALTAINIFIFFLLIFAAFFVAIFFLYAPLFVIFDKMPVWDSIVASAKLVSKNILMHILFLLAWGFIVLISAIPLGLGLLVTIPALQCSIYAAWSNITNYDKTDQNNEDELLNHLID